MKKIILLLIMLITLNVNAKELYKKPTDYYFHRIKGEIDFSDRFNHYIVDGKTAYCIEPGVKVGTTYDEVDFSSLNINKESMKKIKLYAYFGYDYKNHQNIKYLAAAQSLIWKEISGYDMTINFSTNLFSRGDILDISSEVREIQTLANNYYVLPSFAFNKYDVNINEEINLIDKNNVLNEYISDNINYENNIYKIKIEDDKKHIINFKKKQNYNNSYIILAHKEYQNMIVTGNIDNINFNIEFNPIKPNLEIEKKDKESNEELLDATYDIYKDDEIIDTITTNNNGYAKSIPLDIGKYYIKEKIAPIGYELDNKIYEFEIKDSNNIKMDLYDKKVEIKKEIPKEIKKDEIIENPKTIDTTYNLFNLIKYNIIMLLGLKKITKLI